MKYKNSGLLQQLGAAFLATNSTCENRWESIEILLLNLQD